MEQSQTTDGKKSPITSSEVARRCHVSKAAVQKWRKANQIRVVERRGNRFLFDPDEIEAFQKKRIADAVRKVDPMADPNAHIADTDAPAA